MQTVIAINGSPRKKWNTATLLEHALKGAESEGMETELTHLYDLEYRGCSSCFACKQKGGKSYGHHIEANATHLKMMYGSCESFYCTETLQFEDYDKVVFNCFDPEERRRRHREVFPDDGKRAFELGTQLAKAGTMN